MRPATHWRQLMTDSRVIAHMVIRNEMDRYLTTSIPWLRRIVGDDLHVHDDRSDDGSYEYLQDLGVCVTQRAPAEPSFLAHEGRFRQAAWRAMERTFSPTDLDWILCLDADELLLCSQPRHESELRTVLDMEIRDATLQKMSAIQLHVAEFFGIENGVPQMRTDGLWGEIEGIRLVRWRPNGHLLDREESSGSVPNAWTAPARRIDELTIGHFGYARADDVAAKYERYKACRGHARDHIESIRTEPVLVPWTGQLAPLVGAG
jgi:Glycosyl transferase family 2